MTPVAASASARVGLLGNPSDGYGGKALAVSFYNFRASVRIDPADDFRIVPGPGDALAFPSLRDAGGFFQRVGCDDGLRLVRAAIARFCARGSQLDRLAADDPRLRLSISYETTIPRQVGLAGSSAIIIATLRALAAWFGVEIAPFEMAELALRAEVEDLGHAAGAMDRVIQSYEGLMVMDLREPRSEARYGRLHPAGLPPFVVAWDPAGGDVSGRAHGDLRARWLAGDREVLDAVEALRALVDEGVAALRQGDAAAFRALVDRNFEIRTRIFHVGPRDREMVAVARAAGAAAKLCGSGGAVLAVPADPGRLSAVTAALEAAGFACVRPKLSPEVEPGG